jgi:hypothetical protein
MLETWAEEEYWNTNGLGIRKEPEKKRSPTGLGANGAKSGKAAAAILTVLKTRLKKLHLESHRVGRGHAVFVEFTTCYESSTDRSSLEQGGLLRR